MFEEMKYGNLLSLKNKENYHEFKNTDEVKKWGKKYYFSWGEMYFKIMKSIKHRLSSSIYEQPLESYCGNTFSAINKFLRFDVHSESYYEREIADLLTIAIHTAPRIPNDIIVYRLVNDNFIQDLIDNNKKEIYYTREKAFMSTGMLKGITKSNERYTVNKNLLKIYVKKGTVGLYVNAITNRKEEEILFPPNFDLAMINYPYKDNETKKVVYECKLIDPNNLYDASISL